MSELKPCPFCGGTDIGVSTKFGHAECGQCGATGPWSQHDEAFLAAELRHYWCLRPIEDALRAEVAKHERTIETLASSCAALLKRAEAAEAEVAALKAELAKYTEPLTEEQADCAVRFMGDNFAMLQLAHFSAFHWDAAIRRVRAARTGEDKEAGE